MSTLVGNIVRRIISLFLTLFIITAVLYATVLFTPAETRATLFMPKNTSSHMTEEQYQNHIENIIQKYHLNDPYPVQYYYWLTSLVKGNWGYSPTLEQDVLTGIIERTPVTVELTLYSLLVFIPFGLISGVIAASKEKKPGDHGFRIMAFIATSLPPFILALLLLVVFYVDLYWFAPGRSSFNLNSLISKGDFRMYTGMLTVDGLLNRRLDITIDALRHLVMPVFTLAVAHWATLARVTRVSMIDELKQDYVVAARARGIGERRIIWRHTLRNATAPALTSSLLSAAALLTSVFVVEIIFSLHGISEVAVMSMAYVPDSAAALGFAIYNVIIVWFLMVILDLLQSWLNPRMRQRG